MKVHATKVDVMLSDEEEAVMFALTSDAADGAEGGSRGVGLRCGSPKLSPSPGEERRTVRL